MIPPHIVPKRRTRSPQLATRRAVIGTITTGVSLSLAGCSQSRVEGRVSTNETPLALTHEYATRATYSGTRVVVEVVVENMGDTSISLERRVPRITCTFLNDTMDTLLTSSLELVNPLDVNESTSVEFPLTVDTTAVTQYVIKIKWVEE